MKAIQNTGKYPSDQSDISPLPRILIVEDDAVMVEMMQSMLGLVKCEVQVAHSGKKALSLIQREAAAGREIDLILLDIMVPDMDGYEVLTHVKADPTLRNTSIIIVSALDSISNKTLGLGLGADDYLAKPFEPQELVARIDVIMRTRRSEQALQRRNCQLAEAVHQMRAYEKRLEEMDLPAMAPIPFSEFGRLVSGIVHDLRGGLGIIRNTAGFMLDKVDTDSTLESDLSKIIRSTQFCELVARNLTVLGGGAAFEPNEVSIKDVVTEVFFMLERKLVDVKLVIDIHSCTSTIIADEGQMKQVFMNLIKNAGEAMPDGGTLTVRVWREGSVLCVEVSDTGCGISPENQTRLFKEFFTTKQRGYGLGLYIVDTIVRCHGGTIQVKSKTGEGTTFTLRLPIEPE